MQTSLTPCTGYNTETIGEEQRLRPYHNAPRIGIGAITSHNIPQVVCPYYDYGDGRCNVAGKTDEAVHAHLSKTYYARVECPVQAALEKALAKMQVLLQEQLRN